MHFNSKSHQKKIRKTFFRGVELIRVEVMKSRETLCHNDIQKEIHNWGRNGWLQLSFNQM